jgi:hypothetical protein
LDWGALPDWLSGIGTVAAFFIALILLGKELNARKSAEEDRRRAQARLITIWWKRVVDPETGEIVEPGSPDDNHFCMFVKNSSQEAVYDCSLQMVARAPEDIEPWRNQGPTVAAFSLVRLPDSLSWIIGTLPPGETLKVCVQKRYMRHPGDISVEFTDTNERAWIRKRGVLQEKELSRPPIQSRDKQAPNRTEHR